MMPHEIVTLLKLLESRPDIIRNELAYLLEAGEPIADAKQARTDVVDRFISGVGDAGPCMPPDINVVDGASCCTRCSLKLL